MQLAALLVGVVVVLWASVLVVRSRCGAPVVAARGEPAESTVALGEVAGQSAPVAVAPRQPPLSGVWLDMPKKPWPGQNRAPCEPQEKEIQLKDGSHTCWVGVTFTAEQCKTKGYEYQGKCFLPSYPPPKVPQSAQ